MMAEPNDSYNNLVYVLGQYDQSLMFPEDVQKAIINAVQNGNDKNVIADLANPHPMPDGRKWIDPKFTPQSVAPRNDQPIFDDDTDPGVIIRPPPGN